MTRLTTKKRNRSIGNQPKPVPVDLPRPEKILLAIYQLSGASVAPVEYEDIVVKSWQMFPDEFGLRKYVHQYPDSSDQHKPLYGPLKDRGFVLSGNKKFRLTEKGLAYAERLDKAWRGQESLERVLGNNGSLDRLSRDKESQLRRICDTDAFKLFVTNQQDKILDTDFYTYLGVTVRTERHEFLGHLQTVTDAIKDGTRVSDDPKYKIAAALHEFLCQKFEPLINRNRTAK
jgi:hypothetical protein